MRLTIRAAGGPAIRRTPIALDREGQPADARSRERWAELDPTAQATLQALVEASREGAVDPGEDLLHAVQADLAGDRLDFLDPQLGRLSVRTAA